jgi:hypothetical protein
LARLGHGKSPWCKTEVPASDIGDWNLCAVGEVALVKERNRRTTGKIDSFVALRLAFGLEFPNAIDPQVNKTRLRLAFAWDSPNAKRKHGRFINLRINKRKQIKIPTHFAA